VFKARVEAETVCSHLNAEHPRQSGVGHTSETSLIHPFSELQALDDFFESDEYLERSRGLTCGNTFKSAAGSVADTQLQPLLGRKK
jgi:hypothetical protein